jgi:hypothetical protein
MLDSVRGFSASRQNGMFINSCFAHCQSERQDTWYANNSPRLGNKVCVQQLQTRNHLCSSYTVKFLHESSVLPILMTLLPFLATRRELLKLSGTGSWRGETRSTLTAHTLAITPAIISSSGETIKTNYSLPPTIRMAKGTYPQRV